MNSSRRILFCAVLTLLAVAGSTAAFAQSRSVGQVIDDTAITAEVKARLTADQLSNLTKIGVSTRQGVVTLTGSVDAAERAARAAQIAASVGGVREVVNEVQVVGGGTAPTASSPIDATGVVASSDPAAGTVTLQDGRVLRLTDQTMVWQSSSVQALQPGSRVLLRGATPAGVRSSTAVRPPEWRMGTVRSVDPAASQLTLADGTVVRVPAAASIHRGSDHLPLERILPGSEVVIRTAPPLAGGPDVSASPGRAATSPTIDAAEIDVVWTPSLGSR